MNKFFEYQLSLIKYKLVIILNYFKNLKKRKQKLIILDGDNICLSRKLQLPNMGECIPSYINNYYYIEELMNTNYKCVRSIEQAPNCTYVWLRLDHWAVQHLPKEALDAISHCVRNDYTII